MPEQEKNFPPQEEVGENEGVVLTQSEVDDIRKRNQDDAWREQK